LIGREGGEGRAVIGDEEDNGEVFINAKSREVLRKK